MCLIQVEVPGQRKQFYHSDGPNMALFTGAPEKAHRFGHPNDAHRKRESKSVMNYLEQFDEATVAIIEK